MLSSTSESTHASPYEKSTWLAAAPLNPSSETPSSISTVCGSSSSTSSTRAPDASVCCSVEPRFATAMTGPNDDMSAAHAIAAGPKAIVPLFARCIAASSMPISRASTTAPVAAMATAVRSFRRPSTLARLLMRQASSRARSSARPNCSVSRRPRRLSSTNAFMEPMASRTSRPPVPLAFDEIHGTAMPTTA